MKLSVSVPDDLWERARTRRPDLNPSRLVQEALDGFVDARPTPGFSTERPEDADVAFARVRGRFADEARQEFERGYTAALEAADELEYWCLESLAKQQFDVTAWARSFASTAVEADIGNIPKDWAPNRKIMNALLRSLGSLLPPFGDNMFTPWAPYLRGYEQAMRDLWAEVFEGRSVSVSGSRSGSRTGSRSGSRSSQDELDAATAAETATGSEPVVTPRRRQTTPDTKGKEAPLQT